MRRPARPDHLDQDQLGVVIVAAVLLTAMLMIAGARIGLPLWLCGVAAVSASLVMVQFLARGMTAPLRAMATAAGEMAEGRVRTACRRVGPRRGGRAGARLQPDGRRLGQVDRERAS